MTTERHAWTSLHPCDRPGGRGETCACGQELDTCTHRHCPRCGATLAHPAA